MAAMDAVNESSFGDQRQCPRGREDVVNGDGYRKNGKNTKETGDATSASSVIVRQ